MHFHVIKSFPLKILFTRELHYIMVRVENTVAAAVLENKFLQSRSI
uniref:Uncharacterized protein n=1 Tax=Anguilla anguilla TaxID=7936 RepID=A0A0E9PDU3_ANGAN